MALGRQAGRSEVQGHPLCLCFRLSDRSQRELREATASKNKTKLKTRTNPQGSGRNLRGLQRALQNARGFEACELRGSREGITKAPFLYQATLL